MITYIIRRLLLAIPVLLLLSLMTFIMVRMLPGGPFDTVGDRQLPPEVVANKNAKYHLDWPMWKQYLSFLVGDDILGEEGTSKGLIRGDLGWSLKSTSQTVTDIIRTTLPASVQLGLMSLILALVIGIPAGILAALRQNSMVDYVSTFGATFFLSVPNLVLGPLLIWIVALELDLLAFGKWGSKPPYVLGVFPRPEELFSRQYWELAAMPVFALGSAAAASIARLTRGSLLQVIREDYMDTAKAKGLNPVTVVVKHALKNSLIPVVTILGPLFASLVTGTFVVERIFGINGMGKHFVESIGNRDYTVLMGVTLLFSFVLIMSNLLVDITYAWLDPRIRYD